MAGEPGQGDVWNVMAWHGEARPGTARSAGQAGSVPERCGEAWIVWQARLGGLG